ncbi:DNA primase regulatory subunit PriL [Salinibaculum rarum]|uniref:DNA primase regulatory subunit PriL n=1 Tax=Salinibaculum rarum TaxID=3058903 RepID=UPI00265DAB76|nr:DNA primase regulatory subunit PriL [Salinibaculum sp. KK48]
MKPLHARYPFLDAARQAVQAAEVDLAAVVADESAVVQRALARVEGALQDGTVGDTHRRPRVELLSYPVARVIVSLVDEHVLTRKYARAEAATAYDRFTDDFTSDDALKSTQTEQLSLEVLLGEFDLARSVRETPDGYHVDVGAYLDHAADQREDEWRLVNRDLTDGEVPLSEQDLLVLLRQAVSHRIEDGLPFDVPDPIGTHLDSELEHVRELLADLELTRDIDTVVPEMFPPCMKYLLDQVQKGKHLEHHSRFAIASFLTSIGMETEEIVELFQVNPGFGAEATRYQVDHISGETSPTEYSPPSCATMQSYGDCVNMDDLCEKISHPMAYYEAKLDDSDEEELTDWRERQESNS